VKGIQSISYGDFIRFPRNLTEARKEENLIIEKRKKTHRRNYLIKITNKRKRIKEFANFSNYNRK